MSTFCVFGLKFSDCVIKARKIMPEKIGNKYLSMAEFSTYSNLLAEHLYADDESKVFQISPAFDAPHFARDWIDLAEKTGSARRMKIMNKAFKVDGKGEFVLRKGKKVLAWTETKV